MGNDENRGVIKNRKYATQIRDFSGLRFGKITPTDIDGLLDFGNKAYVLIETKYGDSELPYGQRLAIERVVDDLSRSKPAIGIIARHNTSGDIDVAKCIVSEIRYKNKWTIKKDKETVRRLIEMFLKIKDLDDYLRK